MEKLKGFLKKYWYVWLIAFTVSLIVMLIGTSVVGNFIYKLFSGIFQIILIFGVLALIYTYTFGKDSLKIWGIFRLIGFLGTIIFGVIIYSICENKSNIYQVFNDSHFAIAISCLLSSIFFIFLGETLLYFAKYNYKLTEIKKIVMICPTCYGKGFVDLNDIERLGKKKIWEQGFCGYCKGTGSVKKGKTLKKNPLDVEPQNFYL